ncbi:MAG TPA: TonB-dependent receptor [Armatimonadota bacterium]
MKNLLRLLPGVLAIAISIGVALSQNSTGSISGLVRDSSAASIGGARIQVTNQDTGLTRALATNELGQYTAPSLPVGAYSVRVEKAGFRAAVVKDVKLEIQQVRAVEFTLEVGEVKDTVTVESTVPLIETQTSQAGQVIKNEQVSRLPINVRQFLQLAYLAPMAVPATNDFRSNEIDRGSSVPAGAGTRPENNNYQIDGMDNREDGRNNFAVSTPVDSISEFKVQTGNAPAEFGRGGGIIINVATKSGTNQLHGSLYEFLRNNKLDARPYFSVATAPLKRNQFGASLGGPIKKNRLFFFGNYEGYRQAATGNPPVGQVFTPDQRNGVFTTTITDSATGAPFPNNTIPGSRISPISSYILKLVPLPNNPGIPTRNFIFSGVPSGHAQRDNGVGRVDYNLDEKNTIYGRYLINDEIGATSPGLPAPANSGGTALTLKAQNVSVSWSHVFNPNLLNTATLGYARYRNRNATLNSFTNNLLTPSGITNTLADTNPLFWAAPAVSIPGYIMPNETTPSYRTDNNFQFQESVVWNHGPHTLKFGADLRSIREYMFYTGGSGGTSFGNAYTGSNVADFLLGYASSVNKTARASDWNTKVPFMAFFAQDDWKVTSRLTVNLGVRYEVEGALRQSGNNWVDWSPALGSMVLSSSIANKQAIQDFYTNIRPDIKVTFVDKLAPYDTNKKDFAPRVGLAYQLAPNWVIRSAYGMFYSSPEIQSLASSNDFAPNTLRPVWTADPKVPNLGYNPEGNVSAQQALKNAPLTIFPFISRKFPYGQVHQWNFSVQRQLTHTLVLEALYQGTAGEHLVLFDNIDARAPGPGNGQALLPYPGFARIQNFDTYGHSSYHGAAVKLEQRLSNGISYLISYTRSKSLDNGSGFISNRSWVDPNNKNAGKGPSDFNVPQRFSAAYEYTLPFGKGHHVLGSAGGAVDRFVSGLGVRGVTVFQNGLPQSPSMNLSRIGTCATACSARPDRVGDGNLDSGVRTIDHYYDVTAFQLLPAGGVAARVGNAGRNILTAPGINNFDLGVFKNTRLTERQALEFRWEMFNAFNHTQFGGPGVNLESPASFGVVTSTAPPRIMQFVLRYSF